MTTVTALLTNKAYGFPTRGAQRRVKAPILACIHITGNRRTAANPDRHEAARRRAELREPRRLEWSVRPLLRRPRRLGDRGDRPGEVRRLVER